MAILFNQKAVDDAKKEVLRLKTAVEELGKKTTELPKEIRDAETRLSELERERYPLQKMLSDKTAEFTKARSVLLETDRHYKKIQEDVERFNKQVQEKK